MLNTSRPSVGIGRNESRIPVRELLSVKALVLVGTTHMGVVCSHAAEIPDVLHFARLRA